MTLLYRSKTGLIASAGSRQLHSASLSANAPLLQTNNGLHKMEDRIWHGGMFRFIRLENKQESCVASVSHHSHSKQATDPSHT
jgi:hypothetical protein